MTGTRRNTYQENNLRDDEYVSVKTATARSVSTPRSAFNYELWSFDAFLTEEYANPLSFWIGNVVEDHHGKQSVVHETTGHWFEY